MSETNAMHDDDLPAEIDFSQGVRGKFLHVAPVRTQADVEMLRHFGAAPEFPERLTDQAVAESARWFWKP